MGNNKELQDWYVQHGICKTCGQENAAPNRKYCWGCLAKAAEATEKYIKNMSEEQKKERKEKEKERRRKRYVERKAAGKCTKCGKRPPQAGKTKCTECLLKSRRAAEKCRRKKGVIPRTLFGDSYHCALCGIEVKNKKLCGKCYKKSVHAAEIARANIQSGGWRSQNFVFGKGVVLRKNK